MKLRWDNQHVRWGVTAFLVIAASMLFYYGVFHMKTLITGIQTFLGILTPIVYGVVIAFLLTPLLNFLEKTIIYPILQKKEVTVGKNGRKAIRWACVLLCMFLFLALIYPKRYEPDLQLSNLYESQPEMASECFGEMESEQSGT